MVKEVFLLKLKYTGLLFAVLLASGCSNDNNNEASKNNNQPQTDTINYETESEQNERLGLREQSIGEQGGYPQTDQDNLNRGDNTTGNNTDVFTNEQSKKIADLLMKRQDIKAAQVAVTDEKIVIGVMLNDHSDHDITKGIKEDVRKYEPNKTIVVYTDDINWDRKNNLRARLNQSNLSVDIKEGIKEFFNPSSDR